jgi:hypothetical protein
MSENCVCIITLIKYKKKNYIMDPSFLADENSSSCWYRNHTTHMKNRIMTVIIHYRTEYYSRPPQERPYFVLLVVMDISLHNH